jgi:hypothetical protein
MMTLKDHQVDRRKVKVRQRIEPKRTNSHIDFLRSLNLSELALDG